MKIGVVTLFPEMFAAVTDYGVTGRAVKKGLMSLECWNPRDYTQDRHQSVDDKPYGGGPGMVMLVQPLRDAIRAARAALPQAKVIYCSPQGRRLDQAGVEQLAANTQLILVAGRYEGVDERVIAAEVDEEWSIGDYVLSGGELPGMVMIDAVARRQPGVVGDAGSVEADSFAAGLLDCPHYTRPEVIDGRAVPAVLLSGDHENIRCWRLKQALGRTWQRRPDLIERDRLSAEEQALLDEFLREQE
ncbi:MAG: tRNA (guanosine(37)-N1)-methyltransferase TrmD [Gammaproteobacteria bacterium]|nr:tRNA (guanosine(37)-N1)-methyltransferase TrmD [Gammaproteobacteria bacterium]